MGLCLSPKAHQERKAPHHPEVLRRARALVARAIRGRAAGSAAPGEDPEVVRPDHDPEDGLPPQEFSERDAEQPSTEPQHASQATRFDHVSFCHRSSLSAALIVACFSTLVAETESPKLVSAGLRTGS